jgi:hypothetical protein
MFTRRVKNPLLSYRRRELVAFARDLLAQRRRARALIREFALADPTLWPILSEIDLALSDRKPKA